MKILKTPQFEDGKAPPSSFATLKNPSTVSVSKLSLCLWIAPSAENKGEVLSKKEEEGFSIHFKHDNNFITIDGVDIKFEFPASYRFPEKWLSFCFTFADKSLKIFLDSKRRFGEVFDNILAKYEISEEFLSSLQFGKATNFAGKISDLNIWSTVLYDDKILRLYECREIS